MTENEKDNAARDKATATEALSEAVIVSDAAVVADPADAPTEHQSDAAKTDAPITASAKKDTKKDSTQVGVNPSSPRQAETQTVAMKKTNSGKTSNGGLNKAAIIWLAIIIIIVGAASAAGWWFWQSFQQQITALNQQQQVLLEEWQTSQNRIKSFEQLNASTNEAWKAGVKSLESMVIESAQRMSRQANRNADRWPLEEALTLTRLAEQRLQLDSNAQVAVGLMKAADKVFAGLDQAAVLPIRRQLAKDILALQSTSAADINGHYFTLDAIAQQIQTLKWVPKPATQTEIPANADPATGFWHSLKQVVVITRLDVPYQAPALQSDFERWRQHTLLLIEQTQLALLARNQPLFDAAITQLQSQLATMVSQFKLSAEQQNLSEMQGATLNPQWPNIGTSVTIIEQYLAELEPSDNAEDAQ